MAVTVSSDLHQIQQIGKNAVDVAFKATPLLAIPGLVEDVSGRISDAGGDSVTFSVWETDISAITQTAVRNSRTGVTPSKLSLTSYNETAITKVVSIDGDQFSLSDSSEDAMSHISAIVGKEFSRVVQANLITQAVDATNGTDLEYDGTAATMTVAAILQARLQWGDHASDVGTPTLFMRSKQYADLAITSDFKALAAGGMATPAVAVADWSKYIVAQVYGVNIVLLDSVPLDTVPDPDEYTALMVAPGAFGAYVANDPFTVKINHPGSAIVTLDTHFRFATTMFRHNPRRVVKLVTQ